ncbi:helix-turn-helix domain-containing protein [Aestuariirhabdus litorea]|uniref:XRE family transcriptional regulator n=1 Tax=Aestuariirhabdus litorea TaxID=2528527 RepID=A0A3P3VJV4_9GAMM|nr:XRE family transcriptional regulator [Aestuariirhabdus litorea]RRJ83005.1 XRE family transcriptional regulator [Aestuariirhabdus litorea]RWW93164.1 helix-turn-helix domain-containing protein [Endozoicomonadaceae bacterium GTF-13]
MPDHDNPSSILEQEREIERENQRDSHPQAESQVTELQLGKRVREIRLSHNLTLEEASQRTGLARSTLSKIENEQLSPTFQAVQKLAKGLNIDIPQLFATTHESRSTGRRDITRAGEGRTHPTPTYEHEILASALTNKRMLPYKSIVRSRSFDDYPNWVRHEGEEFLLVLSGKVRFFSEYYQPVDLEAGDSSYYDGSMGHALISISDEDAEVLWVTSS